jgi:uncharacterized protein (DUF362 family)
VELMGGMKRFVRPGQKVVIKPNMSFPAPPERASNTHPDVVRELALMCREAGAAHVAILDNPLASADRCLEAAGIREALTNVDGASVRMIEDPSLFHETDLVQGTILKKTDIMRPVLEAHVLIAAPVAKSHSGAGVSLSMKGMMGLIQDRIVMHRLNLAETIVDVASHLKPHLVVIDATRVLSTGGPGGPGTVIPAGTVIASTDMVAADAYTVSAFEWYGQKYRPDQVRHIRVAHERGLGRMDWENLRVQTVTV